MMMRAFEARKEARGLRESFLKVGQTAPQVPWGLGNQGEEDQTLVGQEQLSHFVSFYKIDTNDFL